MQYKEMRTLLVAFSPPRIGLNNLSSFVRFVGNHPLMELTNPANE